MNVLIVGWGDGAVFPKYAEAAANIRTVAREVNLITSSIKKIFKPSRFVIHCIGHSLGAHMCGLVGKESEVSLDRISALDPAGPSFDNTPAAVRIDAQDANFVDVVHTNAGQLLESRFGMLQSVGDIDFYVNGGGFQQGCPSLLQTIIECIGDFQACKGGK